MSKILNKLKGLLVLAVCAVLLGIVPAGLAVPEEELLEGLYLQSQADFDGDEAGIKSAVLLIEGLNAYGLLKGESGVHRLVRVSPFDASGRRHTSFASVEVMPEISDDINIEIRDEDIKVEAHRASGAGGQHVNKTDSAIRITHLRQGSSSDVRMRGVRSRTGKWP